MREETNKIRTVTLSTNLMRYLRKMGARDLLKITPTDRFTLIFLQIDSLTILTLLYIIITQFIHYFIFQSFGGILSSSVGKAIARTSLMVFTG